MVILDFPLSHLTITLSKIKVKNVVYKNSRPNNRNVPKKGLFLESVSTECI